MTILIQAGIEQVRITREGQTRVYGRTPLDIRPMRIRIGVDDGEGCTITLRWDDATDSVCAKIGRRSKHGHLARIVIDEGEAGGLHIEAHVAGNPEPHVMRPRP